MFPISMMSAPGSGGKALRRHEHHRHQTQYLARFFRPFRIEPRLCLAILRAWPILRRHSKMSFRSARKPVARAASASIRGSRRHARKAGVELISITQTVSSEPSGEMFRKLLNVFDEHQSRENAKQVHRAMCETPAKGFGTAHIRPLATKPGSLNDATPRTRRSSSLTTKRRASCARSSRLRPVAKAGRFGSRPSRAA